jgi:hypothetical protein
MGRDISGVLELMTKSHLCIWKSLKNIGAFTRGIHFVIKEDEKRREYYSVDVDYVVFVCNLCKMPINEHKMGM